MPFTWPGTINWDVDVISNEQCREDVEFWISRVELYLNWTKANCTNDTDCTAMQQQALDENLFAIKQLDSFGKPPSNILGLNVVWLGSWDECINVKAGKNYAGKFFWINIAPDLKRMMMSIDIDTEISCDGGSQLRWSVCMPESCGDELELVSTICFVSSITEPFQDITALFRSANNDTDGLIEFCNAHGHPTSAPKKNGFCLFVGSLVIISSLIDYLTESLQNDSYSCKRLRSVKTLLFFSIYTNGAEILSTKKRAGQIHSLNCIRAVSMTWVVICHIIMLYQNGDNPLDASAMKDYFLNEAFLNGFPAVDSFLFIGGVLLGFLFFKEMKQSPRSLTNPVYWSLYYIHRYPKILINLINHICKSVLKYHLYLTNFRLSIPYFTFLGFYTIIWPYVVKGPQKISSDIDYCKKYWWRNVLYITNFFPSSKMCMIHTWYLSTDMWIHNFSPILLIPLVLSPIVGGITALALMILTIGATYGVYYKYDFPPTSTGFAANLAADPEGFDRFMKYVYTAPWIRYIPNLIGILFGYILHRIGNRRVRMNWVIALNCYQTSLIYFLTLYEVKLEVSWKKLFLVSIILWIAAIATGIGCIYGLHDYNRGSTTMNKFQSASYNVFHRVGWSLALGWAVLACQWNKAGFIKNFMEHGFWMPLARLGYCAYLVHFLVIYTFFSQDRTVLHFVGVPATYMHVGLPCFILSYAFAFVWSVCIEIPFAKLEKMITSIITGKRPHTKEITKIDEKTMDSLAAAVVSNSAVTYPYTSNALDNAHRKVNPWSTDELHGKNFFEEKVSNSWKTDEIQNQTNPDQSASTEEAVTKKEDAGLHL
uniref:NRF domain-containing protein n=1 Tax=Syphacia muris TaxID=451379 RepID=A0A0N5ABK0_9BILA